MISPEAVELNASFRRDIKDSGQFNQPVDEVRANWDEFGQSIPVGAHSSTENSWDERSSTLSRNKPS